MSLFSDNPILHTDSYKPTHAPQYPKKTRFVRSYLEARGGIFDHVITYGALNYYVQEKLMKPVTKYHVEEAHDFFADHYGNPTLFNRRGWEHIINKHGGFLPLRVRAVIEGLKVPVKNFMMGFENTDLVVPWLTNYMETPIYPWYPYTVATLSNQCRQTILKYLIQTGDPSQIDFKLQDFGYRGATCDEAAAIGGSGHLVNFKGSDTIPAILFLRKYYGIRMAGFSIPASEHSTISSWMRVGSPGLRREGETAAYRNMVHIYPTGLVACVSDTDDIYYACEHIWGELLHDEVLARDGVLIIRPDSGNPVEVVLRCLDILGLKFGFTVNAKGYKVLNPKVRIIQGDGVDPVTIDLILSVMAINGWSADNIAFGMGGALLQKVNRDTMKWATKCSEIDIDGMVYPVFKNPVTDPGKRSKSGNLTLYAAIGQKGMKAPTSFYTAEIGGSPSGFDVAPVIYDTGRMFNMSLFDSIRDRVRSYDVTA
jgi:nicotinamide phosphoribosyltransferase